MKDDYDVFFNKALKFLSYRPRSIFEVREYLLKKDISPEILERVLHRLAELDFINDKAFGKWWIEQRSNFQLKGQRLIKLELQRKGIARELIEKLFSDNTAGIDENGLAEKLALKKFERLKNLPEFEIKRKLYASLAQKGFSFEVIEHTVAKILKKG